jgi:hypothetical protein
MRDSGGIAADGAGVSRRERYWWIPVALLLCLSPICWLGYGSDNDTYGVLQAGYSTWHLHVPLMSRNPGYWTYEAAVYGLSKLGGYVLTNGVSFAMAAALLWRFFVLAGRLRLRYRLLFCCCLVAIPTFAIAAASTMDYLWALLCVVLAGEMLLAERYVWATVLAALAISLRASSSTVLAGGFGALLLYELYLQRRVTTRAWKLAGSGVAALVLGLTTYVASYRLVGNSMIFLRPMVGPPEMWTMKFRVGWFVYRGMYLLGPLAMLVCVVALGMWLRSRDGETKEITADSYRARLLALSLGIVVANVLLFFKFPIEVSYLLPAAFFFLLIAGATLFRRSLVLSALLLFTIFSGDVVRLDLLQHNGPGYTAGAHVHVSAGAGAIAEDVASRQRFMACRNLRCWSLQSGYPPSTKFAEIPGTAH